MGGGQEDGGGQKRPLLLSQRFPRLKLGAVLAVSTLLSGRSTLAFNGGTPRSNGGQRFGSFNPSYRQPMRVAHTGPTDIHSRVAPPSSSHAHAPKRPSFARRSGVGSMRMSSRAAAAPKLIIAGAPASGKGTQCELLKEYLGVVHLSTGDMLRAAVKEGTPLGLEARKYMDAGKLVPDDLIIAMVKQRLTQDDCQECGWLLDGFPRTKAQAEALNELGVKPDAFIMLNVPDNILVERVVGRRTDPDTGKIYHLRFSPPPPDVPADRLVQRSDDTEEKVKVRLTAFHEHCDAVRGCYQEVLVEVDGTQIKDAVFKDIIEAIAARSVKKGKQVATTRPPTMIIAGAPASGKGTQCELLKERYGVVHLSTGDILRAAVKEGTPLGKEAKAYMDAGKLVPDSTICGVVLDRLAQEDCRTCGWLLDGFPRTKAQAEALRENGIRPDAFIMLDVPDEMLVERVVGRRTDPETGKIYHLRFSPPPTDVPTDRLVQRSDDTEEKIKVRLKAFHEHCDAVRGCYEDVLVEVDGTQAKESVYEAITSGVDTRLEQADVMEDEDDDHNDDANRGSGRVVAVQGGASSSEAKKGIKTGLSLASFVAADQVLKRVFLARGLAFPSALAGMMALFLGLLASAGNKGDAAKPSWLYRAVKPGSVFLTRWLAVFFAPSLVLLPLSSSSLTPRIALRLIVLAILGFEASLFVASRLSTVVFPRNQDAHDEALVSHHPSPSRATPPSPFGPNLHGGLAISTALAGVASIAAHHAGNVPAATSTVLRTLFTALATLLSFVTGARMPSRFKSTFHPLITCTVMTIALVATYARAVGSTLTQQLKAYVTSSACSVHMGGGDVLLALLGPSILAMAVQVFESRKLLFANAVRVVGTCLGSSLFGLFSSALLARALNLPKVLSLSTVSRCITTPLAMSVARLVGADVSIAVLLVVISGLLGASQGGNRLDMLGAKDPVTRGLAMGSASHGIGTASLTAEPQALAFSAISMALTGVLTCTLVSIPLVRSTLVAIATGGSI